MEGAMKKIISLLLAMASTMFLFVGATQAAERFDSVGNNKSTSLSGTVMDGPALPCAVGEEIN